LFAVFAHCAIAADTVPCPQPQHPAIVELSRVLDGDTVVLADGRHLRLIGIDTPELGRDGRAAQPGAEAARQFLAALMADQSDLQLVVEIERFDVYRRTLGHLLLSDGTNVQQSLLGAGLALPLVIPPNVQYAACYARSAAEARAGRLGLWALPQHQPLAADDLRDARAGYRVLRGTVTGIGHSQSSVWIELGDAAALRIARDDLPYFSTPDFAMLPGMSLEARGRLYRRNGQWRMRIRHPAELTLPAQRADP
jgi:endonuclease YncB( thermonuclease family)